MKTFISSSFLDQLEYGLTGGPLFNTSFFRSEGGVETPKAEWGDARPRVDSLRSWNLTKAIKDKATLKTILDAVTVLRGRAIGFLFLDPFDHTAVDESIDTGGAPNYQLRKAYTVCGQTVFRNITHLDPSVQATITANGVPVTLTPIGSFTPGGGGLWGEPTFGEVVFGQPEGGETVGNVLDYDSGIFTSHGGPLEGPVVWSGQFFTPVRLDTDSPMFEITRGNNYVLRSLPLVEIKL